MEPQLLYKSFNENKTIEELEYNIKMHKTGLENIKFELQFLKNLLNKPIFNPHAMNLFETLSKFKNEIKSLNKNCEELIERLISHANKIRIKMECEDVACDLFFIKKHDAIELNVFNFNTKIYDFKFKLFQFTESVLND
ncbi:hypothetical protein [uncultured Algibacter sp.]|uniref:hypothetical protein n=1 Tax=uncultured Algibacter sp. TaxID=298659 RepID=UPI00260B1895|nr:hypothetical protein [uncultured Algibacter sp.]